MHGGKIAFMAGLAIVLALLLLAFLPAWQLILPFTRTDDLLREQWRTIDQIRALNIFDTTSSPTEGQLYRYYSLQIEQEQRFLELVQSLNMPINGMEQAIQESKERERIYKAKLDQIGR
ncbi:hypothetical protein ES707_20208 [subsurface metagenome]